MKKFLLIWFAFNLALSPVASAFSTPMTMAGSETREHCMGHEMADGQPQDMRMDCCDSEYDQKQCCDHCVSSVSALLNTLSISRLDTIADPVFAFAQPVLSAIHSPPYKPPQA